METEKETNEVAAADNASAEAAGSGPEFEPSVAIDAAIAEFASDATPVGDLYRSAVNAIGIVVTEAKASCGMGRGKSFRFGHIVGEGLAMEYVDKSDSYIKAAGRYAKHLVTMAMSLPYWKTMGDKARHEIGDACDKAAREMAAARIDFNRVKRKVADVMDKAEAAARENPVRMVVGVNGETEAQAETGSEVETGDGE